MNSEGTVAGFGVGKGFIRLKRVALTCGVIALRYVTNILNGSE